MDVLETTNDILSADIDVRSSITATLVRHSATDLDVVRAARVSTASELANEENLDDAYASGLIEYLMKSRHGSPFEHNYMTFLVTAPIFAVRHLMRHRTWSFNEESARYRKIRPIFYLPDDERDLRQVGKPGHYQYVPGNDGDHGYLRDIAVSAYASAFDNYSKLLERGIAKELARIVLPVATYSTVYATCNARGLMHFLGLRTSRANATYASAPQREIEEVADQMEAQWPIDAADCGGVRKIR